ncbi:VOC family protein [Brachybacterium endophyticum]|uniref:VOC family protein n=1 Tax=Brachybacterium endophyticum TaxID=2182385 RepID=A0A2U2RPB2_9MICO|nr:VOC family protein [Brachybacterium endophyticum]PWH07699.1 VOC family protein [Brachybacterium endophyticum]
MSAPTPYLFFPGTAREALEFYREVFGGELSVSTAAEMEREDLPADAVAHAQLDGPVQLYASDSANERPLRLEGLMFALLGTADPTTLRTWFAHLAAEGEVVDDLQRRPWGASDGQVRDRFGVLWLIGYEHSGDADPAARAE